jgi:hypothetical protein
MILAKVLLFWCLEAIFENDGEKSGLGSLPLKEYDR